MKQYVFSFCFFVLTQVSFARPISESSQEIRKKDSVDLKEAFLASKSRSELLVDQDEQIKQIEEQYKQALGTVLPNISGIASWTRQASSGAGNIFPELQRNIRLNLSQTLFRGFKEFALLKASTLQKDAQIQLKRDATKSLFNDVSQNYFTILSLEEDIRTLKSEMKSYKERDATLQYRIRIGRSRLTERMAVQSLLANIKAQIAQNEGALKIAREAFAFLTGLAPETRLSPYKASLNLAPLEFYLVGEHSRADVQAANIKLSAAEESIKFAERELYPSLDLGANYYILRDGALKDIPWDVNLTLNVPIYDGGTLLSRRRQAISLKVQAANAVQVSRRKAHQEIRSFYETVVSDLKQESELQSTFKISKQNIDELKKEYNTGLASNLEVLQAMSTLDEAERNLRRVEYLVQLDYVKLTVASEKNEILRSEN